MMRLKKEIDRLSGTRGAVTFPEHNVPFYNFKSRLRELVAENFGHAAAESFNYDDYSKTFYFGLEQVCGHLKTKTGVRVTRQFFINPANELAVEFERVEMEISQFKADAGIMLRATIAAGGEA